MLTAHVSQLSNLRVALKLGTSGELKSVFQQTLGVLGTRPTDPLTLYDFVYFVYFAFDLGRLNAVFTSADAAAMRSVLSLTRTVFDHYDRERRLRLPLSRVRRIARRVDARAVADSPIFERALRAAVGPSCYVPPGARGGSCIVPAFLALVLYEWRFDQHVLLEVTMGSSWLVKGLLLPNGATCAELFSQLAVLYDVPSVRCEWESANTGRRVLIETDDDLAVALKNSDAPFLRLHLSTPNGGEAVAMAAATRARTVLTAIIDVVRAADALNDAESDDAATEIMVQYSDELAAALTINTIQHLDTVSDVLAAVLSERARSGQQSSWTLLPSFAPPSPARQGTLPAPLGKQHTRPQSEPEMHHEHASAVAQMSHSAQPTLTTPPHSRSNSMTGTGSATAAAAAAAAAATSATKSSKRRQKKQQQLSQKSPGRAASASAALSSSASTQGRGTEEFEASVLSAAQSPGRASVADDDEDEFDDERTGGDDDEASEGGADPARRALLLRSDQSAASSTALTASSSTAGTVAAPSAAQAYAASGSVGQWLASLHLQELEPLFASEQISLDVIPKLTAEDLKDMNLKLGPRKKLLAAIDELKALKASLSSSSSNVMSNLSTAEHDGRGASESDDGGRGVHSQYSAIWLEEALKNEQQTAAQRAAQSRAVMAEAGDSNEFPYREIDYSELRLNPKPIGRGAFGVVFRGEWRGASVAVKKLMMYFDEKEVATFRAEAALMHAVNNHPHIVNFVGAVTRNGNFCLVTDFCKYGSVYDVMIKRQQQLPFPVVVKMTRDAASGILHLHKERVIHRDIAARNFLLGQNYNVFVADFGLSRVKSESYGHTLSTMGPVKHMAPEAISKKQYSEKSDAYSFGVFLWEIMHRQEPYAHSDTFQIASGVVAGTLRLQIDAARLPEEAVSDGVFPQLMHDCWRAAPRDRPDFDQLHARLSEYLRMVLERETQRTGLRSSLDHSNQQFAYDDGGNPDGRDADSNGYIEPE
jgi:hypothetical protein